MNSRSKKISAGRETKKPKLNDSFSFTINPSATPMTTGVMLRALSGAKDTFCAKS
ncbi:hypothetical protein CE91St28_03920 [Pyramidobacter piscolens]|nr:hypothetical protein CE91St28_03920 [Pyramidobacter piscolens]